MALEFAADPEPLKEADLILPITAPDAAGVRQVDWRPMVASLVPSQRRNELAIKAARFHHALARCAADMATQIGVETVALSGGCFQNVRLLDATRRQLQAAGFNVLCHRDLPPNDGGLSAGQALGVLWGLTSVAGPGPHAP
jgi:hydrogenase maturation protein HypF